MFGYRSKTIIFVILVSLLFHQIQNQTYCSAFCSYYNNGSAYNPMCNDQTASNCTKCDEDLFTLSSTNCVVHGLFNETLQITDLTPPMGALSSWTNTTGNAIVNTRNLLYEILQFFTNPVPPLAGDDVVYRVFTSLPPHFAIRARFFVLRDASASMNFYYYLDNNKFQYDYSTYPTSLNLGGIVTTQKISHKDSSLTVAFEAVFTGANQFIGVKELLIFLSKCSNYCSFCDSSQNCVTCGNLANGTRTYLYQGYCYVDCPETLFQDPILNVCQVCLDQCQNCNLNSSYCSQCKFQGRNEAFLLNNTCYQNCPNGFFQQFENNTCICPVNGFYQTPTHICQACAPQCNSCFGSLRTECYNCSAGNFLVNGTSWCSNTCPSDQYGSSFTRMCYNCAPSCSSCYNTSTQCRGCFFTHLVRFLHNQKCIAQCPSGYGKNTVLKTCQKCSAFYYSFNGQCTMDCPNLYVANNESKSCLHLSETNFTIWGQIQSGFVLIDGQSVAFTVYFSSGLSENAKNWLYSQTYYSVFLKGQNFNVSASSITIQTNELVNFIFKIPAQISEESQISIDFGKKLNSSQNVFYSRTTSIFKISENPDFLGQYFKKSQKNYFNMIFIPVFLILAAFLCFRLRASYEILIQYIRTFQLVGVCVFLTYPMESQIFYLMEGINYFNMEFFPNVYNMVVPNFVDSLQNKTFLGFQFLYGDMDFIRMIGSILLFIAIWITLLLVFKFLITKNNLMLGWMMRLGMDLIQIKILHSYWNSLIFTIINADRNNLYILWVHIFSYVFVGLVLYRYFKIYQHSGQMNYFFIWRLLATLLISLAVFNRMIVLIFLTLFSFGFGLKQLDLLNEQDKQTKKFRYGFAFTLRDYNIAFMPFISVMAICLLVFYKQQMDCYAVIAIISIFSYLIVVFGAVVLLFLRNFYKYRQKSVVAHVRNDQKWRQKQLYNEVNNNSTFQNVSQSYKTDNQSYMKDQFVGDFQNMHNNDSVEKQSQITRTIKGIGIGSRVQKQEQEQFYQEESEEGPIEAKLRGINKTQYILRKRDKLTPLRTIGLDNQKQDIEFEKISLSKNNKKQQKIQRPKTVFDQNVFIDDSKSLEVQSKN